MSFVNPDFLRISDQSNRTPGDICQSLKPLPHVIRFMRRWHPEVINETDNSAISNMRTMSHTETSSVTCSSPFLLYQQTYQDDDDSDDLEDQAPSHAKKSSKLKKRNRRSIFNCPSLSSCFRFQRFNSLPRNVMQCFSSLLSKNSEEFSKIPFRCFFGSILLSLYYVIFVFYPLGHSPPLDTQPSPLYASNLLYLLNIFGQVFMWISFLITHYVGHSRGPPMPAHCHQQYYSSLIDVVRFYSTSHHSLTSPPPSLCHFCRLLLPLRCKHCKELNRCLLTFDHYCYFIWCPVYRQNYLYFFLYLIAMVLYIPIFLISSVSYLRYHKPSSRVLAYFLLWCIIQWIFVLCLLYYFIQSISLGQTTNERIKQPLYLKSVGTNPFHRGSWLRNFLQYRLEMYSYNEMNQSDKKDDLAIKCQIYFQREDIRQGI